MSLRNKYKVKQIKSGRRNNLSVNLDSDYNFENVKNRYPVMLFTPDMEDTMKHWHIQLNTKEARKLRDWLNEYLKMKGTK